MKKVFIVLLLARSLCLLGTGGCQLFQYWEESHQSNQVYSGLEEYVRRPDTTPDTDFYSPPSQDDEEAPILIPDIDFASLQEINPDIVGWLYCEDTPIHYPVVQGEDNSYYLKHLFDGTYNANGCLFLDSRVKNDFSEAYSIIYGHHMKNGTMFSSLDGYKRQEYYEAHPNLLLITPEQTYLLNLFSGYVASVEDHAWDISFQNELKFEEWLISATENSCFESHVCPSSTDRILTLSTCSYEFDNARFVILGILEPITKD